MPRKNREALFHLIKLVGYMTELALDCYIESIMESTWQTTNANPTITPPVHADYANRKKDSVTVKNLLNPNIGLSSNEQRSK